MAAEKSAGRETPDISELRREVSLPCDASGEIVWADDPATRLLGVASGDQFVSRAAPATEAKLTRMCDLGANGPVRDWNPCLVGARPPAVLVELPPTTDGPAHLHTCTLLMMDGGRSRPSQRATAIRPRQRPSREVVPRPTRDARVAAGLTPHAADREAASAG